MRPNNPRGLDQVVAIVPVRTKYDKSGKADLKLSIQFNEMSFGADDPDIPLSFSLGVKRCAVGISTENMPNLSIPKQARKLAPSRRRIISSSVGQETSRNTKGNIGISSEGPSLEVGRESNAVSTAGQQVEKEMDDYHLTTVNSATGEPVYVFSSECEAPMKGAGWQASPHVCTVINTALSDPIMDEPIVYVECTAKDLTIDHLEPKTYEFSEILRVSASKRAVALAYLKNELIQMNLRSSQHLDSDRNAVAQLVSAVTEEEL